MSTATKKLSARAQKKRAAGAKRQRKPRKKKGFRGHRVWKKRNRIGMSFQCLERRKFLWDACQLQIRRMHICSILKQLFPKDSIALLWDKLLNGKFDLAKVSSESQRKRLKTQIKLYRYYQRQNKLSPNAHDHSPCYAAKILGIDREAVYRMLRYMARVNTWLTKSEKGFKEIDSFAINDASYFVTDKARGSSQEVESARSHPCPRRTALHDVAPSKNHEASVSKAQEFSVPEKKIWPFLELISRSNFVVMSFSRSLEREIYAETQEFELPNKEAATRKYRTLLETHLQIYPEKKKLMRELIQRFSFLLEKWEAVVYHEDEAQLDYERTGTSEDLPPAVYAKQISTQVQERKQRKEALMQISTFEGLQDNLLKSDIEAYAKQHARSCKAEDFDIIHNLRTDETRFCPGCGQALLTHEEIKTKATEARAWLYQTNQWLKVNAETKRWERKPKNHFSMWNSNASELPEKISELRTIVGNIANDRKFVA